MSNRYVPNAGQKLERLDYRVERWDAALRAYLLGLQVRLVVLWDDGVIKGTCCRNNVTTCCCGS